MELTTIAALIEINATTILSAIVLILDVAVILSVLGGRGSLGHKVLWCLLILLLPVIGLILYFLFGRSRLDA